MKKDLFYGVALNILGALLLYGSTNVAVKSYNALELLSPFKPSYTVVYICIFLSLASIAIIYFGTKRVIAYFKR